MAIALGVIDFHARRDHSQSISQALQRVATQLGHAEQLQSRCFEPVPGRFWLGVLVPQERTERDFLLDEQGLFVTGEIYDGVPTKGFLPSQPGDLLREIQQVGLSHCLSALEGQFFAVWWDATSGSIAFGNDTLGRMEAFIYRGDELLAFSTNLLPLALSGLFEPTPSLLDVQYMVVTSWCPGNRTILQGVEILPPGTVLQIRNNHITSQSHFQSKGLFSRVRSMKEGDWAGAIECFRDAIRQRVAEESQIVLSLSGGLDSRALLAGFISLGIQPECVSFGPAICADREISELVARRAGLSYTFFEHQTGEPEVFLKRARQIAFSWSGTRSAKYAFLSPAFRDYLAGRVRFEGVGAEVFRGYYYPPTTPLEKVEQWDTDILSFYLSKLFAKERSLLFVSDRFRAYLLDRVSEDLNRFRGLTDSNLDLIDLFHWYGEIRRCWATLASTKPDQRRTPFLDSRLLPFALRMSTDARKKEEFHYRIIDSSAPWLLHLPLARWGIQLPTQSFWHRALHVLKRRIRGTEPMSGVTIPAGDLFPTVWDAVNDILSSRDCLWRHWLPEERMRFLLNRECLEAPCKANHLQKVGSAFWALPVGAVVHRH